MNTTNATTPCRHALHCPTPNVCTLTGNCKKTKTPPADQAAATAAVPEQAQPQGELPQPFYVMLDTQEIQCIGTHPTMPDAMDVEPGNSVWTFSHAGLQDLLESGHRAMAGQQRAASPIERILVLSTAHISAETNSWISNTSECLNASDDDNVSGVYFTRWSEYGWIFSVGDDAEKAVIGRAPELAALFAYCVKNHISHLRLDADASTMDGFQTYTW